MMHTAVARDGRVHVWVQVSLPMSAAAVWEQARQFTTFTTVDPFHRRMRVDGPLRPGASLVIEHAFMGLRLNRVGRLLRWDDGTGYALSDLSSRGASAAFPHIYEYRVVATGPATSMVVVSVRGKWTARFLPRWLIKAWLAWVMSTAARMIENHLLAAAVRPAAARREEIVPR